MILRAMYSCSPTSTNTSQCSSFFIKKGRKCLKNSEIEPKMAILLGVIYRYTTPLCNCKSVQCGSRSPERRWKNVPFLQRKTLKIKNLPNFTLDKFLLSRKLVSFLYNLDATLHFKAFYHHSFNP